MNPQLPQRVFLAVAVVNSLIAEFNKTEKALQELALKANYRCDPFAFEKVGLNYRVTYCHGDSWHTIAELPFEQKLNALAGLPKFVELYEQHLERLVDRAIKMGEKK